MILKSRYAITKTNTVSNTAMTLQTFGFSAADSQNADRVTICVTAGALRVTYDIPVANPPTTAFGLKIPTNNYPLFVIENRTANQNLQMIREAAADATVVITLEID